LLAESFTEMYFFGGEVSMRWLTFIVLVCNISFLYSYVPKSLLFEDFLVSRQKRSDGSGSNVLLIKDVASFYREVIRSARPTVVRIVTGREDPSLAFSYQEVADQFVGRVVFVNANISKISNIVNAIMVRFRMRSVTLPLVMFFSSGALVPTILSGVVSKEKLVRLINKLFFSSRPASRARAEGGDSIVDKISTLSDSVRRWLFGFRRFNKDSCLRCLKR
jgi:hypothetical protein